MDPMAGLNEEDKRLSGFPAKGFKNFLYAPKWPAYMRAKKSEPNRTMDLYDLIIY